MAALGASSGAAAGRTVTHYPYVDQLWSPLERRTYLYTDLLDGLHQVTYVACPLEDEPGQWYVCVDVLHPSGAGTSRAMLSPYRGLPPVTPRELAGWRAAVLHFIGPRP